MGKVYDVYTDGACKGNPGKGGWGWVQYIKLECGKDMVTMEVYNYGGQYNTTNNKMEMKAIEDFLRNAEYGNIYNIHTDSLYVLKTLVKNSGDTIKKNYTGWLHNWLKTGFKKNEQEWRCIDNIIKNHLENDSVIKIFHVKGHSGNVGNERADELANKGVPWRK